jgi:two-component system nitrate/nitrite response regulator NarL
LDAELGGEKAVDFIQTVKRKLAGARILVLTAGVAGVEAVGLVQAGVAGIIHKQHSARELAETIRRVAVGEVFLEAPYLGALMRANDKSHQPGRNLTDRDWSVMRGVVQGLTNREIGGRLKISEAAVKASLRVLFEKVGVKSRAQLVKLAMEEYRERL